MHELGIMTGVAESVTQAAQAAGATKVYEVRLSVGRMTEAIEEALFFAFEVLQESYPLLEGCKLVISMVEPRSRCLECGKEYEHDRFHMLCPHCGSAFTQLLQGKELSIESIDAEVPDES